MSKFSDLGVRTVSAVVLAGVAFAAFWLGGWISAALLALGAALMVWEYREMVFGKGAGLSVVGVLSALVAALAVLATQGFELRYGIAVLLAGGLVVASLAKDQIKMGWAGMAYIGFAMACIDGLRDDPDYGFRAVVWLVLVVIAADVGGYFGGRVFGGPKLWPRVSPKKTWAGLIGGMVFALLVGAVFSALTVGTYVIEVGTVSALIALVSVGGDLLESSIKRHFGVKDSSNLIPGHGGLLDRFDGLMAAAIVACVLTFMRGQSVFIW